MLKELVLVVYFSINSQWIPGDIIFPDGWSSIRYSTESECIERMEFFNKELLGTDSEEYMIARCEKFKPGKYI